MKIKVGYIVLILFSLFAVQMGRAVGLKIVRQYPTGIMTDAMPWEMKETDGWLYIASDDGLIQYDGFFPEVFEINNRRNIRSVNIDREKGRVYVGGISEFGYFEASPESSLRYICLSDSIGEDRIIGNIWGIYPSENHVIVQGDNNILIYDAGTNRHVLVPSDNKLDVSANINGVLWVGTSNGLKILLGNSLVNAPGCDLLTTKRIRAILEYGNGLLIVTGDGVWRYENQQLRQFTPAEELTTRLGELFSATIRGDQLVLGSVAHGLGVLDLKTGTYDIYDEGNGLTSNTIISLQFDSQGNLWVGQQYGIGKIFLQDPVERIDNSTLPIGTGSVMALYGNRLYLGTNRGLYSLMYDTDDNQLGKDIREIEGMRGQVWGLNVIDGLLFASLDKGLFTIEPTGNIKKIDNISGVWDVKKINGTTDRAYAGAYDGIHLLRKRDGKWVVQPPVEGYYSSAYNFVQEKPNIIWNNNADLGIDRIIIDTIANKIVQVENFRVTKDGTPLTSDAFISRIDNNIYFATAEGLYTYEPKNNEIVKEKEISRLLGNPKNLRRLKKTNGSIFALAGNELISADPAGILETRRISLAPGVARPTHELDVFFPMGPDYLGYPTRSGYLIFDYSSRNDSLWNERSPSARIHDLMVTNREDSIIFKANIGNIKNIPELKHTENSIRITFGSPEDVERGVLFSTRLNHEPWTQPSPILIREFSDLKEGKYTIDVKAITPQATEKVESIVFRVLPPWWRTKWMLSIYAVVLIFMVFLMIRLEQLRVNRRHQRLLNEKNLELEQQKSRHMLETEEKDRQIERLEREQIDKELKHKAQEVANVMMSLSHKNETLQTVKRELQNISAMVPRGNSEIRKAINDLQEKVVVDIKSDDVLKRVEEEFDIVHDNFMKKLRTRFPDLNNNEILLCAYIKMNLSTKEIAPLLNISMRGVETMRYRMRRKLELERDDSLSSFIQNFN